MKPIVYFLAFALKVFLSFGFSPPEIFPPEISPPMPNDAMSANNEFTFSLLDSLHESNPRKNQAISPWSLSLAFGMLSAGAKGDTLKKILNVFKWDRYFCRGEGLEMEIGKLISRGDADYRNILIVAAGLWVDRGTSVKESFKQTLENSYAAPIGFQPFSSAPWVATRNINFWIEQKTKGKIKQMFSTFQSRTRLVLASAAGFYNSWMKPFPFKKTKRANFKTYGGITKQVLMMNVIESFMISTNYEKSFKVLVLPYMIGQRDMIVVLPTGRNTLANVIKSLAGGALRDTLNTGYKRTVNVFLPKFHLKSNYELQEMFKKLGLSELFSRRADLSGITTDPLTLHDAAHKVDIKVDERGSTASGATGISAVAFSMPSMFKANRPFLFIIRDKTTGLYVFAGIVTDPSKN